MVRVFVWCMEGFLHPKDTPGDCFMYSSGIEHLQGKVTTKGKGKDRSKGNNVMCVLARR